MCGIAGIFAYQDSAPPVDREELLRIREGMRSCGPDGEGLWVSSDGRVGLAHRRLAIIGPKEEAAQPMASSDGKLQAILNGAIYNYRELRRSLEKRGCEFISQSDTEVLLHLYREFGAEMLAHLRGMYAFAIWDHPQQTLFVARDPLGIKPLYYADNGETIRIASQVRALVAGGRVDGGPEPAGHVGFLLWGYVPEPHTIYRGVRALPAGCAMWAVRNRLTRQKTIFSVSKLLEGAESRSSGPTDQRDSDRIEAELRSSLLETVRHHLVADVPVGLFLASGVYSGVLAGLMSEVGADLRTLTLGFPEFRGTPDDETPVAEEVARLYGANHRTSLITQDAFRREFSRILSEMDQPSIGGLNMYLAAQAAAREGIKVVLSELGADELFTGYAHFRQLESLVQRAKWAGRVPGLGKMFRVLTAPMAKCVASPKYAAMFEFGSCIEDAYLLRRGLFMPWELPEFMDVEMAREGWRTLEPILNLRNTTGLLNGTRPKIAALEMSWYLRNQLLRDADWAGMAHSVEIRTPYVDWHLLRAIGPLLFGSSAPGKAVLARTLTIPLPSRVMSNEEAGFCVPIRKWIEAELKAPGHWSRGWAKFIYRRFSNNRRTAIFLSDAFGGFGGISKFNRDLLTELSSNPKQTEIVALPRVMSRPIDERLPNKLRFEQVAAGGKWAYLCSFLRLLLDRKRFDAVICGHINLLPASWLFSRWRRVPLVLICHGIEAWQPTPRPLINRLVRHVDYLVTVSALTYERLQQWARLKARGNFVLPNTVDLTVYQIRPKKDALVERYGLHGKTVLMTLARLSAFDRYKGIDEVLEVMPRVVKSFPNLVYVVAGGGQDLHRLQSKAQALEIADRVIFTGFLSEEEKPDHYNLADVFVMPGRGEGFGIVYLEAMACGVPVVGSVLDGSREALLNGKLGVLVNPLDLASVEQGIKEALKRGRGVPTGLEYFSYERFRERTWDILEKVA